MKKLKFKLETKVSLKDWRKKMTVDITWAKDKSDITTYDTQTKTFNSEEQAIEWIRRNAKHIVSINHRGFFISEQISHFDIMDCLMNGY